MLIDNETTEHASQRMSKAALQLARMAPEVAAAKQVVSYDSDRRKRALAVLVVEQLDKGVKSVGECEARARASASWGQALQDLGDQLKSATRVVEEHNAVQTQYEAARSVLSLEKEKMKL